MSELHFSAEAQRAAFELVIESGLEEGAGLEELVNTLLTHALAHDAERLAREIIERAFPLFTREEKLAIRERVLRALTEQP